VSTDLRKTRLTRKLFSKVVGAIGFELEAHCGPLRPAAEIPRDLFWRWWAL
jgi:hypothetical protein